MRDIKQEMDNIVDTLLNKTKRELVAPVKTKRTGKRPLTQEQKDEYARLVADVQSGALFR